MDSEVSITKPSYPFLALVGFERFEENFVEFSKNVIINSKLDSNSLGNGLILELWSLVEVQTAFNIPLSPGNISRREFAELIGCFLFKWTSEDITRDFIKKYANPRDYKALKKRVDSGSVSELETWEMGTKLLERIASKSK